MAKIGHEITEFMVTEVYNDGCYILHISFVVGTLKVGDEFDVHLDVTRNQ